RPTMPAATWWKRPARARHHPPRPSRSAPEARSAGPCSSRCARQGGRAAATRPRRPEACTRSARPPSSLALTFASFARLGFRGQLLDQALHLATGTFDERLRLLGALAVAPQHIGGDPLGIGRIGPAHPDPDAPEIGAAKMPFQALESVVPGQPTP